MIYVGIDDTDVLGSPGTNQLARSMVAALAGDYRCRRIVRHQLLDDPRVPYTSKNGSASITLEPVGGAAFADLVSRLRDQVRSWFVPGSDPGLCVGAGVPPDVREFGRRCKSELVTQEDAYRLAQPHGIHLEGLGGTCGGVIGALAAVGLAATDNDGRVVRLADWPDDLSGFQSVDSLRERGVLVRVHDSGVRIDAGLVDVGKRLRPNRRHGEDVLFVARAEGEPPLLRALKIP